MCCFTADCSYAGGAGAVQRAGATAAAAAAAAQWLPSSLSVVGIQPGASVKDLGQLHTQAAASTVSLSLEHLQGLAHSPVVPPWCAPSSMRRVQVTSLLGALSNRVGTAHQER